MTDFIQGENRYQITLFPEQLDELDLTGLGFEVVPQATGRPAYHPATML